MASNLRGLKGDPVDGIIGRQKMPVGVAAHDEFPQGDSAV
jgi:hypothetical protein